MDQFSSGDIIQIQSREHIGELSLVLLIRNIGKTTRKFAGIPFNKRFLSRKFENTWIVCSVSSHKGSSENPLEMQIEVSDTGNPLQFEDVSHVILREISTVRLREEDSVVGSISQKLLKKARERISSLISDGSILVYNG